MSDVRTKCAIQPETIPTVWIPSFAAARPIARKACRSLPCHFIESTAGEVAAELARRGVAPNQRVTITIEPVEPADWITEARRFARPKVIAEGWSDEDIDRIIEEERDAVQSRLG